MKRWHGIGLCLSVALLGVAWAFFARQNSQQEAAQELSYEDAFQASVADALASRAEEFQRLSEADRRAAFDREQQAILSAERAREAARLDEYERRKQRAWANYYQPAADCVTPSSATNSATITASQAQQCRRREQEARAAFELFYDPGEISVQSR